MFCWFLPEIISFCRAQTARTNESGKGNYNGFFFTINGDCEQMKIGNMVKLLLKVFETTCGREITNGYKI
jgi:hypothetical protein